MNKEYKKVLNHLNKKDKNFFLENSHFFNQEIDSPHYKGSLHLYALDEQQDKIDEQLYDFLEFLFSHASDNCCSEISYGIDKEIYYGVVDYAFQHNHIDLKNFQKLLKISEKHNPGHTLFQLKEIAISIEQKRYPYLTYPGTIKSFKARKTNNSLKGEFAIKAYNRMEKKLQNKIKKNTKKQNRPSSTEVLPVQNFLLSEKITVS